MLPGELLYLFGIAFIQALFGVSAASKLGDFTDFTTTIATGLAIESRFAQVVGSSVLVGEFFLIVLLLPFSTTVFYGLLGGAILLVLFSGFILLLLKKKINIACHCFGANSNRVSHHDIYRNIFILLLIMICYLFQDIYHTFMIQDIYQVYPAMLVFSIIIVLLATRLKSIISLLR